MNLNERVVCNSCGYCMDVDEQIQFREEDTNWNGARCPECNTSDDFEDITEQWAVDELRWYSKKLSQSKPPKLLTIDIVIWSRKLSEISNMIEAEIE